jgi:hypothetical protein
MVAYNRDATRGDLARATARRRARCTYARRGRRRGIIMHRRALQA